MIAVDTNVVEAFDVGAGAPVRAGGVLCRPKRAPAQVSQQGWGERPRIGIANLASKASGGVALCLRVTVRDVLGRRVQRVDLGPDIHSAFALNVHERRAAMCSRFCSRSRAEVWSSFPHEAQGHVRRCGTTQVRCRRDRTHTPR